MTNQSLTRACVFGFYFDFGAQYDCLCVLAARHQCKYKLRLQPTAFQHRKQLENSYIHSSSFRRRFVCMHITANNKRNRPKSFDPNSTDTENGQQSEVTQSNALYRCPTDHLPQQIANDQFTFPPPMPNYVFKPIRMIESKFSSMDVLEVLVFIIWAVARCSLSTDSFAFRFRLTLIGNRRRVETDICIQHLVFANSARTNLLQLFDKTKTKCTQINKGNKAGTDPI